MLSLERCEVEFTTGVNIFSSARRPSRPASPGRDSTAIGIEAPSADVAVRIDCCRLGPEVRMRIAARPPFEADRRTSWRRRSFGTNTLWIGSPPRSTSIARRDGGPVVIARTSGTAAGRGRNVRSIDQKGRMRSGVLGSLPKTTRRSFTHIRWVRSFAATGLAGTNRSSGFAAAKRRRRSLPREVSRIRFMPTLFQRSTAISPRSRHRFTKRETTTGDLPGKTASWSWYWATS